ISANKGIVGAATHCRIIHELTQNDRRVPISAVFTIIIANNLMPTNHAFPLITPTYNPYDLLRVYTYYRTLLGSVLLLMFQGGIAPNVLGNDNPDLFFYTSTSYTLINFISLSLFWRIKFLPSQKQLFGQLCIDLLAITLLMHSSG